MYILLGILLGIGFSMMDVSLYNAEKKQENWNKPVYYIVTIICYVVAVIISFIAKLVNGTDVVLTISIGLAIQGIVNQVIQKKLISKILKK